MDKVAKAAIGITVGVAAGAVGTVVLVPAALGLVGFTAGGITAGSVAAGMMSSAAIANGGGVAAGSLVAVLQSVGAAGVSAATTAGVASTGGVLGGVLGWFSRRRGGDAKPPQPPDVPGSIALSVPETVKLSDLDDEDKDDDDDDDDDDGDQDSPVAPPSMELQKCS